MALFDYIEVFYNLRRRHSTIGYLSPAAFERHTSSSVVRVDGALVGTLASTPSSLTQADERLQGILRPLITEMNVPTTINDAN
jgi:hypothetical protein